jgi:hypothetical protein
MWKNPAFPTLAPGSGFAILVSGSMRGGIADDGRQGN